MYVMRRLLPVGRIFQYIRLGRFSTFNVETATVFESLKSPQKMQADLKRYNSEKWEIVELERAAKEELQLRNHEARLKESGNNVGTYIRMQLRLP